MADSPAPDWRVSVVRCAPIFLWIGVIFYLSSDQGSMAQTSRFIRPLLEFIFPGAPEPTLQLYHGYIRRMAHFGEYAVLAFLALRAFVGPASGMRWGPRYSLPLALVALVATLDEINQSFQASRRGSVRDVLLDFSGGLAMVLVLWAANLRKGEKVSQHDGKSSNTD